MPKWFRRSALARGGTPPPPTAATTLSDGPIELPILPPSPTQRPVRNAFENNPLPPLTPYAYPDHNDDNVSIPNTDFVVIELAEHTPGGPGGWRERAEMLSRKKTALANVAFLLVLVICLVAGVGLLWKKGDKGKVDSGRLTRSTSQPPALSTSNITLNSIIIIATDLQDSTIAITSTKRMTTVTSTTTRATQTPSAYANFQLRTGTFDSVSPLVSSSGACRTGTSTTILQECAENARFKTTIAEFKPDGYAVGTSLWVFRDYMVHVDRSGKQWYYSGNSIEKKYWHASSPSCEVVEKAELWLGKDGAYVLGVNHESTNTCTLDDGNVKNPTAQVCECTYQGVLSTVS